MLSGYAPAERRHCDNCCGTAAGCAAGQVRITHQPSVRARACHPQDCHHFGDFAFRSKRMPIDCDEMQNRLRLSFHDVADAAGLAAPLTQLVVAGDNLAAGCNAQHTSTDRMAGEHLGSGPAAYWCARVVLVLCNA